MKPQLINIDIQKEPIRIFYTSDIHGSEICYKKFLNAGKFYKADIIILGGDICGKMLVPIVRQDNSFYASFQGRLIKVKTDDELKQLKEKIRLTGSYYVIIDEAELKQYTDESAKNELFLKILKQSIREWVRLAEERLKDTKITCLIMPGNDDPLEIDHILEETNVIINPENKIIDINGVYQIVSTGYSNITPWSCPRDIEEDELFKKIETLCSELDSFKSTIFNFHAPPYNSTLDLAPKLDKNLRIVLEMGQPIYVPVGSIAVRKTIEKYQPMLGLHGHIHESKNVTHIGRTLCINPGSEYSEGILHGVIVDLIKGNIDKYLLVTG
ncbi:MAG: metallophosphoesterase [Nitrososphaerota archaeon]|uniref:metallophosphoesterase family protein n=1 Tax=Saccharolobus sp. TaxID=2100761 RepID=UPI00317CF78D